MPNRADPDGFDLVSLLRENADLRRQLADATAEGDHLRAQLERRLPADTPAQEDHQ